MTNVNPVYGIIFVRTAQASLVALALHWGVHWPLTGPRALGLFLTPALCLYFVFAFVARWSWALPILTRLRTSKREVALTFDDGPSPETTPAILETLRTWGLRATFFVLGEAVDRSPHLLRQIVAEGHSVGVHAFRHRAFVLLNHREIQEEIRRTREAISRACPGVVVSPWLRPPHGFKSPGVLWAVHQASCRLVTWSLDGRDYRETDPAQVAQVVLSHLRSGEIILLHDGSGNAATVCALPIILKSLDASGWKAVLLPSALGSHR